MYLRFIITYYKKHQSFHLKSIITKSHKTMNEKLQIRPTFEDLVKKEYQSCTTQNERQEYVYAVPFTDSYLYWYLGLNFSLTVETFTRTPPELTVEERRRSFDNFRWSELLNATVENLVRNGFYCPNDCEIRCSHCDLFYPYRCSSSDVDAIHKRCSPHCPMIRLCQGQRETQAASAGCSEVSLDIICLKLCHLNKVQQ